MALVIDVIEGFTVLPDTQGKFIGIVPPVISGDNEVYIGSDVSFVASGSVSAFGTVIEYTWVLPDGSTFVGDTLNFHIPDNTKHYSEIRIICFAMDTYDNKSPRIYKSIIACDINMPIINTISWDNNNHFENESYILTIDATDPNSQDLTYEVVCTDGSVGVVQRTGTEDHIFDITYGEYTEDINLTYSVTVTNINDLFDIEDEIIIVHDTEPIINNVSWDDNHHLENTSYILTIDATDPQGLDLTYEVVCTDDSVGVVQRTEAEDHIFDITYGEYIDDANIEFTITVINSINSIIIEAINVIVYGVEPVINNVFWDNSNQYENESYILTIDATDPNSQDLTYEVVCTDGSVTIVQRTGVEDHIFDITYGSYDVNTDITYTITVTNENMLTDDVSELMTVQDANPNIISIDWNPSGDHWENNTYEMTIIATDPQSLDLTYEVVCTDGSVTIVQRTGVEDHIFDITYGSYSDDTSLTYTITVTNTDSLTDVENELIIAHNVADRGVFAGGNNADTYYDTIEYITISAATGSVTDFGNLSIGRRYLSATSNGINSRGVFAGGSSGSSIYLDTIEYITISAATGSVTDFGDLSVAKRGLAATSNGTNDRCVFAGGSSESSILDTIEYINISAATGSVTDFGDLSTGRRYLSATSNGINSRGVFAGGYSFGNNTDTIEYINISAATGSVTDFGDLSVAKRVLAATSNGTNDRGVFAGGYDDSIRYDTIEYITISAATGSVTDFGDLSTGKYGLAATSNGTNDRGVFAGGYNGNYVDVIEYITISAATGSVTDFGDLSAGKYGLAAISNA